MYKEAFEEYINATNREGSNKAPSYLRALELLSQMLKTESFGFDDCINIWSVNSNQRIQELYEVTQREKRNFSNSRWNIKDLPKSYLANGFCSAALKEYKSFLSSIDFEERLFNAFAQYNGDEQSLPKILDAESTDNEDLLDLPEIEGAEGQDVLRNVKTRANQHVFRRMIRIIYNHACCVTELNIPELNRASHIIPWSKNPEMRLDPRNGLYLSATYDAAFDRHLISLDDDYRIILSKSIREYSTQSSVDEYFIKKEGQMITLPDRYRPNIEYLAEHRKRGEF